MSDTIACSNCGTEVPSEAAFCTGCGQAMQAAAAPPPPADATRVDTPGLNDATQVTPPPPSDPAPSPFAPPPPPASDPLPAGSWGAEQATPPTGPPTSAPWNPPASPPPPTWQPPTAPPPGAATFGGPGAMGAPGAATGAPPTWGQTGTAPGAAPAWGEAAPPATTSRNAPSIFGGLVGIIGAVLTIVGVFSGWVKLGSTGTVTAWSLTQGEGVIETQTPYAVVVLAGVAGLASLLLFTGIARTPVRIVTALVGLAIIGVTAANWAEIASYVTDNFPSSFEANTAIGFYLAIAGGVLVFVAALLPAKKK